ncbi:MAG TPA: hypothetical protein VG096_13500 [Bryobacteraceae bacterium]|jgi:hypothetical protein|nr:hypothetical protein [Bryobacteraceae bacterium]
MTGLKLEPRIRRLERQAHIRHRLDAVHEEIARREQEGRNRAEEWLRSQQIAPEKLA